LHLTNVNAYNESYNIRITKQRLVELKLYLLHIIMHTQTAANGSAVTRHTCLFLIKSVFC